MSQEVFSDPSYSVPQLRFFTLITDVFSNTVHIQAASRPGQKKQDSEKSLWKSHSRSLKGQQRLFFLDFFSDEDSTSRPVILLKYVCKTVSQAGLSSQDPGLISVTMSIDPAEMAGEKCFG